MREWSTLRRLMFLKGATGAPPVEATATGNPVTFLTDLAKPLKSLLVPFIPVQSGSGDPSPQNIRPIVAWDGVKVFGGGKNLIDDSKKYQHSTTIVYIGENSAGRNIFLKAGEYTVTRDFGGQTIGLYYVKSDSSTEKTIFNATSTDLTKTITIAEDGYYAIFCYRSGSSGGVTVSDIISLMIEAGSTATAYEPFVPITETDISFPSPVYGGTLDVVTGELWAEYAEYTFTGNEGFDRTHNTQGSSEYEGYFFRWAYDWQGFLIDNWNIGQQDVKVDAYPVYNNLSYWYSGINKGDKVAWTVGSYQGIVFRDDSYESADAFKQAIAGKKMVYKLASPVLITTLTPEQITAIKGNNTIWSDANGNLEITYLKKG